jgi:hypothetical protein
MASPVDGPLILPVNGRRRQEHCKRRDVSDVPIQAGFISSLSTLVA